MNAQDEIVYLLKCITDSDQHLAETSVPRQMLFHIIDIYRRSSKGYRINPMNHLLYDFDEAVTAADVLNTHASSSSFKSITNSSLIENNQLFYNKENVGFFFFRPTCFHETQILDKFKGFLPSDPYLIGYVVHKWEIPWAKLFPLRLFLRLGEQFDCNFYFQWYNLLKCPIFLSNLF